MYCRIVNQGTIRMSEQKVIQDAELQAVIFRLGKEEYGIDIHQVIEIVPLGTITRLPTENSSLIGVINLRGQVIPVMDLNKNLGLGLDHSYQKSARIIITEIRSYPVGFIVDEVPEILKIPLNSLAQTPDLIQGKIQGEFIKGVAKSNERLIVVLEIDKLVNIDEITHVDELKHGENNGKNSDR